MPCKPVGVGAPGCGRPQRHPLSNDPSRPSGTNRCDRWVRFSRQPVAWGCWPHPRRDPHAWRWWMPHAQPESTDIGIQVDLRSPSGHDRADHASGRKAVRWFWQHRRCEEPEQQSCGRDHEADGSCAAPDKRQEHQCEQGSHEPLGLRTEPWPHASPQNDHGSPCCPRLRHANLPSPAREANVMPSTNHRNHSIHQSHRPESVQQLTNIRHRESGPSRGVTKASPGQTCGSPTNR